MKFHLPLWLIDACPPELDACESDCRKTSCTREHFDRCELRRSVQVALENNSEWSKS